MIRSSFILFAAIALQFSICNGFEQTKELSAQTRWAVDTINSRHYLRERINSLDGTEIVESFVESFDHSHMYFSRNEMDEFIFRFGAAMEGFLQKGNLYPAFEMYAAYKKNAQSGPHGFTKNLSRISILTPAKAFPRIEVKQTGRQTTKKVSTPGNAV